MQALPVVVTIAARCPRCGSYQPSAFDAALHHRDCKGAESPEAPISVSIVARELTAALERLEKRLTQFNRILANRNGAPSSDGLAGVALEARRALELGRQLRESATGPRSRVEIFAAPALLRQLVPGLRVATIGAVRAIVYRGEVRLERLLAPTLDTVRRWRAITNGRWTNGHLVLRATTAIDAGVHSALQESLRAAAPVGAAS